MPSWFYINVATGMQSLADFINVATVIQPLADLINVDIAYFFSRNMGKVRMEENIGWK